MKLKAPLLVAASLFLASAITPAQAQIDWLGNHLEAQRFNNMRNHQLRMSQPLRNKKRRGTMRQQKRRSTMRQGRVTNRPGVTRKSSVRRYPRQQRRVIVRRAR